MHPAPFIVGASRSGTTMLRLMLDAHPLLGIPPETHFLTSLPTVWSGAADPPTAAFEAIVNHERWPDFELDAGAFRTRLIESSACTLTDVLRVFYVLYASKHGKSRWGDKTPQYVLRMPQIAQLLPEARFVHMVRDGRDVALSVLPLWFGPTSIEEAASWWVERVRAGRRDGLALNYLEVRYERLVGQPVEELRRVCAFVEIDFQKDMLSYHASALERMLEMKDIPTSDTTVTSSDRALMRTCLRVRLSEPPDTTSVGRWRTEMSADERSRFTAIAGDLLEELDYPLE
jgi:hypothetical protein